MREGQHGFCYVRRRVDDRMVLTTYGRSSGFCVDPIEKKPLHHFHPGTSVLSFGTAGCNLGCRFCQNWNMSKARSADRLTDEASPEGIARAAVQLGCRSVAFTYNDPVIFAEYAMDVADACREFGVRSVAVTAGYMTAESRPEFYRHIDAANVDLKGFSAGFYRRHCLSELEPVLETLRYLRRETPVWMEITSLLIPGENDDDSGLHWAAEWVAENLGVDVPWHFTAFHPDFKMLDHPPTPMSTLVRARRIAMSKGLRFVYTGNVRDPEGAGTYCPECGECVVQRDGHEVTLWNLQAGRCGACDAVIAGHFDAMPGQWGSRRMPVRIAGV